MTPDEGMADVISLEPVILGGGRSTLHPGDCLEVLRAMPDASVDSIVTDPPYGLADLGPDKLVECLARWVGGDREFIPGGRGFMGKSWDSFVPPPAVWDECLRVLKPGGHLLAFAGSRTVDLMGLSIRLAGFEIRDEIMWLYGSGFPKSLDVSKAIDAAAGAEREKERCGGLGSANSFADDKWTQENAGWRIVDTPITDSAKQWSGFGTAMKPAHEPIVVARKPLIGTVAGNVLEHGTGGLNIDGCRVAAQVGDYDHPGNSELRPMAKNSFSAAINGDLKVTQAEPHQAGRWPSNIVLSHSSLCRRVGTRVVPGDNRVGGLGSRPGGFGDVGSENGDARPSGPLYGDAEVADWECAGDCPVAELDRQSGITKSSGGINGGGLGNQVYGKFKNETINANAGGLGDSGGASRYFPTFDSDPGFLYCAKASRADRNEGLEGMPEVECQSGCGGDFPVDDQGRDRDRFKTTQQNHHPTVKPHDLMRWLCRLVTPPGGVVLDPFAGSGSTGKAAIAEGFRFVGIEREPDFFAIARRRVQAAIDAVDYAALPPSSFWSDAPSPAAPAPKKPAPRRAAQSPAVGGLASLWAD